MLSLGEEEDSYSPVGSTGGSLFSSLHSGRRQSRLEAVSINGGTLLVELDQQRLEEEGRFQVPRKNSLNTPTTVGGISLETMVDEEQSNIIKEIQTETAHHSPDVHPTLPAKLDSGEMDIKSQESTELCPYGDGLLPRYFSQISLHLHLAVATPSIVRIPHLAHKYASESGSAFVIAYIFVLVLILMPISVLEMIMGQFSSLGPISIFDSCLPVLKGVGYGMVVTCAILMLISSTLLTWSTFYLLESLKFELPWAQCPANTSSICKFPDELNDNASPEALIPTDYYFQMNVTKSLEISSGDRLEIDLTLAATSLMLWSILLFFVCRREMLWKGKLVSGFLSILTLIMIISIMIVGLNLKNSGRGLTAVFQINFTSLRDMLGKPDLWLDCLGQGFWSLGPTIGLLINRASYNNFHKKIVSDVRIAALMNISLQVLVMIAIFSYVGHIHTSNMKEIPKNLGYFFVMGSYATTECPIPRVVAVLLFFCVSASLFAHTAMLGHTVVTSLSEALAPDWRQGLRRFIIGFLICGASFLTSLLLVTKQGIFYLTTIDALLPWVSGMTLGVLELAGLTFIYHNSKIEEHFQKMLRSRTMFVSVCKYFVIPVLLALLIWVAIVGISEPISWQHQTTPKDQSYFTVGLIFAILPTLIGFLVLLLQIGKHFKRLQTLLEPSPSWGSALSRHSELMMRKLPKRRDRNRPWLVLEIDFADTPENLPNWIPYGYSWIPDRPTAQLMKEGHSDITSSTRRILGKLLMERFRKNRYNALSVNSGNMDPTKSNANAEESNLGETSYESFGKTVERSGVYSTKDHSTNARLEKLQQNINMTNEK